MRNQLVENKEFNIISRSIDNATTCTVLEVKEDSFKVKLKEKLKYEPNESVELFSMTPKGQLYFETFVKSVKNDEISMWFPISYKFLQKREFSRVNINQEIQLINKKKSIPARIIDISAGGLQIITKEELTLTKNYKIEINLDNKTIKTLFEPIRIQIKDNKFIISGMFKNLKNYDRINLVQYCFGKQIENSNK